MKQHCKSAANLQYPSWLRRPKCRHASICLRISASPKPLDEDVVHAAALAVHADPDAVGLQHAGEVGAGEPAALIGVEDLRPAEPTQRLFQGIDAEVGMQRVRKPPGEHRPRVPVHDRHQVDEALGQRNVGNVTAPDLVDPVDRQAAQQVGILDVLGAALLVLGR